MATKLKVAKDNQFMDGLFDIDLITPSMASNLIDKYGDEMSDDFKKWLLVKGNPVTFSKQNNES